MDIQELLSLPASIQSFAWNAVAEAGGAQHVHLWTDTPGTAFEIAPGHANETDIFVVAGDAPGQQGLLLLGPEAQDRIVLQAEPDAGLVVTALTGEDLIYGAHNGHSGGWVGSLWAAPGVALADLLIG